SSVGASWPFDNDEVAGIAESAEGLPGAIDSAAATALNHKYSVQTITEPEPVAAPVALTSRPGLIRAVTVGAIVVAAITWTLWPDDRPQPELPSRPLALPEPPPVAPLQPVFKDEAVQPAAQTPPVERPQPTPEQQAEARAQAGEPPPGPATPPSASPTAQPEPKPAQGQAPDTVQAVQVQPSAKPEPGPVPEPPARDEQPRGSAWLQNQRKDHYVVQLMAARDLQVLNQFIREHSLGSQAAVFTTQRGGLPWHVLLYGRYANADVARASIATLPPGLRKHSPWIRSIASVQKAIRESPP
ncbi:MAG: SPOR domain-containing protein, partial [Gammaproteobacteria bacterium]|nr:SPOR domain-containing protein [Gammaproteobacteria bacterium]